MPISIGFNVGFSGIGQGVLLLRADAGPDRVRVDWGSPDPNGIDPQVQVFLPGDDGSFRLPAEPSVRIYDDGAYSIKAIGIFDGTGERVTEYLNVIFDVANPVGIIRFGNGHDDLISGGSGDDTFYGQGGNDWLFGGIGSDLAFGGAGDDFLGGGGGDFGADTLNGGDGVDLLAGDEGDDLLIGGNDVDFIYAGSGADTIRGGDGDDYAEGGFDSDLLIGGEGNDRMFGDESALSGGGGNDVMADTLIGGNGNDELDGGEGSDLLRGDAGDDSLTGGAGNDTLISGDGVDEFLFGNEGDDRLVGGAGFQRFNGGVGSDTMVSIADGEADWFVYGIGDGYDRIVGFESDFDAFLLFGVDEGNVGAGRFVADLGDITDNGSWIVYDALGRLWIDVNGTDAGGVNPVAILLGAPTLNYDNFIFAALA